MCDQNKKQKLTIQSVSPYTRENKKSDNGKTLSSEYRWVGEGLQYGEKDFWKRCVVTREFRVKEWEWWMVRLVVMEQVS